VAAFGAAAIVRTECWGSVAGRRDLLAGGMEGELIVTSASVTLVAWASAERLEAGMQRAASDWFGCV
jgi:hypothetical protein